jgi:Ser/Thr protein kinase RdoA (MazF antagonist)
MVHDSSVALSDHLDIAYGIHSTIMERLHGGEHSSEVWRVHDSDDSYAVKVYSRPPATAEAARLERWLGTFGLPAQRTLVDREGRYSSPIGDHHVVVRTWAPGSVTPLGIPLSAPHITALGATLGTFHAVTHSFPIDRRTVPPIDHTRATRTYTELLKSLDQNAELYPMQKSVLVEVARSRLSWLAAHPFTWRAISHLPHCALHGDYHQGNASWEAGADMVTVFDLDDFHYGPRVWEFVLAAVHAAVASPFESFVGEVDLVKLRVFTEAYEKSAALIGEEREILPTLLRQASATATHAIECRLLGRGICRDSLIIPSRSADWAWWSKHSDCVSAALTGSSTRCYEHYRD